MEDTTMKLEFHLDDSAHNWLLRKVGLSGNSFSIQMKKTLIYLAIGWLPLAIISLIQGNFWTGKMNTSFITSIDTQARLLVTVPILLLSEYLVGANLSRIIMQFIKGGFINAEDHGVYSEIVEKKRRFLDSGWTDLVILALCYLQVFAVLYYEGNYTKLLSWQTMQTSTGPSLNAAGWWFNLISKPFMVFLLYRWVLRIVIWGSLLRSVSKLNLNIFPAHPDQAGGLGFLGYSVHYFAPVVFAISATFAGNVADLVLFNGQHVLEFKFVVATYLILITILFTYPMFSFGSKLKKTFEEYLFHQNNFANAIFLSMQNRITKGLESTQPEKNEADDFSTAVDVHDIVSANLQMKSLPLKLKDLIPLWIAACIPILAVLMLEVPISALAKSILSLLV